MEIKKENLTKMEQEVLDCIIRLSKSDFAANDFTAKELDYWTGMGRYIIRDILTSLYKKAYIEKTGQKFDGCIVWRLKTQ